MTGIASGALVAMSTLSALLGAPADGSPLTVAEVAFPDVNCLFASDCRLVVEDTAAGISLAGSHGEGFLQTRTAPPGETGRPGEGLTPYLYRIDLREVVGVTALPCIFELAVDSGPVQPLDYDGDGTLEHVFVATRGGVGTVGLASVEQHDDRITFRFEPAVCAGSRPGGGESTFFFGLASSAAPHPVTARALTSIGDEMELAARAPAGSDSGPAPWVDDGFCFLGLPVPKWVAVCRCLRDASLRELRCGVLHPDFLLVRETPIPIPRSQPFTVRWSLAPLRELGGPVVLEDGLPPGFQRVARAPSRLVFEPVAPGEIVHLEYRMTVSGGERTLSLPTVVSHAASPGQEAGGSFQLLLPIGPAPWPGLGDLPDEPLPSPPRDPDFGADACGQEARRLWDEHVERFAGTPFGVSFAEHSDLQRRAERCRQIEPSYPFLCGGIGERAWVRCFFRPGARVGECHDEARRAIERCRETLERGLDDRLGGFGPGSGRTEPEM